MKLTFLELPPFERFRAEYLTDEEYRTLQNELLQNPEKGDLMQGMAGLRKIRVSSEKSNKGKRSGYRVIYYYFLNESQIFFISAYSKNQQTDLTNEQRKAFLAIVERIKSKL